VTEASPMPLPEMTNCHISSIMDIEYGGIVTMITAPIFLFYVVRQAMFGPCRQILEISNLIRMLAAWSTFGNCLLFTHT
jgi:hypothetical protein